MLKLILISYGLSAIVTHGRIFERMRCVIGKHSRLLYEGVQCMQCVGFWSGLVVSLLLGQGWFSILYGFATSGICELTDIVTKKIENMTDYEFQLQNEVSELKATNNRLREELKNCQKQLTEALQREAIAKNIINEKRKEIRKLKKNNEIHN